MTERSGSSTDEVERFEDIPPEFYQAAWQDGDYPQAAVGLNSRFLHVNHAFERLLGYSSSELRGRTWMEFTKQSHVGGDMQSVEDVLSGRISEYTLEKDYIHKRGHSVSIVLKVKRFPREAHKPIALFHVEAPVATATRNEIFDAEAMTMRAIEKLRSEMEEYKNSVSVHVGDSVGGDQTGRDKSTGVAASVPIVWIAIGIGGMIALGIIVLLLVILFKPT